MPRRISSPTLVGRSEELHRVTRLLTGADGWKPLVVVRGEAGIGKSRLLAAVVEEVRGSGAVVLSGACVPIAGRTLPYAPLVDALRTDVGGTVTASLEATSRQIRQLVGVAADGASSESPIAQARLFDAIRTGLRGVADGGQVVLAIEDLHWIDASTSDLLGFLAHSRSGAWLRLVGTLRTDEPHPLVTPMLVELERAGAVDIVDLPPLDADAVREVITSIREAEPSETLWRSVTARAGGNPFFVEELLAASDDEHIRVSPSLSEMLLTRVAPLAEGSLDVLRHMAVIGERAGDDLLAAVTGLDAATLARRLRPVIEAHVITVDRSTGVYAFRHALVREALYADLLPGERRALHARTAAVLESAAGERVLGSTERLLAIATQLDAAGEGARALAVLPDAAAAAAAAFAHADALQLYELAIARWEEMPDVGRAHGVDPEDLHRRAAVVAERTGDPSSSVAHLRAAVAARAESGQPVDGVLLQSLSSALWLAGEEAESIAMAQRAYEAVPVDGDPDARGLVAGAWSSALGVIGRYEEALRVANEAVDLSERLSDPSRLVLALATRGAALASIGSPEEAVSDLERAVQTATESDDVDMTIYAFGNAGFVIGLVLGDAERVLELDREWRERQAAVGLERSHSALLAGTTSLLHIRSGDWAEAERVLTDAVHRPQPVPIQVEVTGMLALLRTWQGRLDEASILVDRVRAATATLIGQQFIGVQFAVAAELAAWRGESARAGELVAEARTRLGVEDPLWTGHLYAVGARACADAAEAIGGATPELRERATDLVDALRYERVPNRTARMPEALAWRSQGEAELARMSARPHEAVAAWGAAVDAWRNIGRPYSVAYALMRQAQAMRRLGDRARARPLVAEARSIVERIGAFVLVDSLDAAAGRPRSPVPVAEPPRSVAYGLTPREIEVLGLVSEGLSNREIAARLFISEKTAGGHVSNILGKLEVSSRVQAAARAVRAGLVSGWAAE